MAEILIQWKVHPKRPALPKRGDVRDFGPNGHAWGLREDKRKWVAEGNDPDAFPDDYAIIRVNGLTPAELRKMHRTGPNARRDSEAADGKVHQQWVDRGSDPTERPQILVHRFKWRVDLSDLPAPKRTQLRTDRFTTITEAQFIAASDHKVKRVRFDKNNADGEGAARGGR